VLEDVGDLDGHAGQVGRHDRRTEPGGGEPDEQELRPVRQVHVDAIAGPDAAALQLGRHRIGAPEHGAPAQGQVLAGAVVADEERPLGVPAGARAQDVVDGPARDHRAEQRRGVVRGRRHGRWARAR
jgi:hypothetical protein